MSYETIQASGQVIRIGNETWENKLIDCTNGNGITMIVEGAADIRNIGLKGLYQGGSFIFSITNTGGTVNFENVYLGDGANKAGESFVHGPGAIFYHRSANCRVEFERMNVQGFPNNGFYCSNTAHGGSVHWDTCYGKNNGVTTFRAAGSDDTIRNCVAYNDNTDYSTNYGSYGGYSETNGRPVWVWAPGDITIEDSHFAAGPYPRAMVVDRGSPSTMRGGAVRGSVHGSLNREGVGSDPDLSVPDGVPTSAEEAASGGNYEPEPDPWEGDDHFAPDADADDYDNRLTINALDGVAEYTVITEEPLSQGYWYVAPGSSQDDLYNPSVEFGEHDGYYAARGSVNDNIDAFVFDGDVVALGIEGADHEVWLTGEEIDPDDYDSPGEYFDGGDDGDDKDRCDRLEHENEQLKEQLAEYRELVDDVEGDLENIEEGHDEVGGLLAELLKRLG